MPIGHQSLGEQRGELFPRTVVTRRRTPRNRREHRDSQRISRRTSLRSVDALRLRAVPLEQVGTARADDFDIIHNGFDFLPLTYSDLVSTPVVTTIHGFSSDRIVPVYERYDKTTAYVSISDTDRHPNLHYAATIHHGIDIDGFAVHPERGGHLLFFGRIHPDKGTAQAIEVARTCGRRLIIAGIVQDENYFRTEVAPYIDGEQVCFVGAVDASVRAEVLGSAHALLHLIDFEEPFGYSVAEAMACGTPVIAYARGSMHELIEHGVTGYLVGDVASAVAAVASAAELDRREIAARAAARFSVQSMVDKYVAVYLHILGNRR